MERMYRASLWLLTLGVVAAAAQTQVRTTIEWNPEYLRFSCDSAVVLRASLAPLAAEELIVGLEGSPEVAGNVMLALASVVPTPAEPAAGKRVFANHPAGITQSAPCIYDIAVRLPERERPVLHVRVKPGTRVTMIANGETVASLAVTRGALLHNGRIITDAGALYVLQAAAVAVTRGFSENSTELVADARGRRLITPKGFRHHLVETSYLKFASRVDWNDECCAGATLVTFNLRVAPNGEVVAAEPLDVPAEHTDRLARLLRGLRLKPFEEDGVPVAAEGVLTLLMNKSGRVALLY